MRDLVKCKRQIIISGPMYNAGRWGRSEHGLSLSLSLNSRSLQLPCIYLGPIGILMPFTVCTKLLHGLTIINYSPERVLNQSGLKFQK